MKLFEVRPEIELIMAQVEVDPDTGEVLGITDAQWQQIEDLEMHRDELALELAAYMVGEKLEAKAVKEQADALAARAKRHANRAERIKAYIANNLEPGSKLRNDVVEISWRTSTRVEVVDEQKIPMELMRVSMSPDKTKIKTALKAGKVPGASLVKQQNIAIK